MFIAWMPRVAESSRTSMISCGVAPSLRAALMCWRTPGRYMWVAFASIAM
jgi:hypothetical protein